MKMNGKERRAVITLIEANTKAFENICKAQGVSSEPLVGRIAEFAAPLAPAATK